ncbi:addiction module antidote protein, HigA family [Azotobacter chroococcum]|nr:addiction module antidote protein, HigA family [Azotobacter chroococcum]
MRWFVQGCATWRRPRCAKRVARRLGFARETLSRILHGHAPISPDLAVRLEMAGIGKARTWLAVQADYDIWQARQRQQPTIERFAAHM